MGGWPVSMGVAVTDKNRIPDSFGRTVLASDPYWGSYIGRLLECLNTPVGMRAKVAIQETVELPSQYAIIYNDCHVRRIPYKYGRTVNFDLSNIQLYEFKKCEGGVNLEEALKLIVAKALEEKLGCPVELTQQEWNEGIKEALNNVYANKFCFFANVTSDDFVRAMVDTIAIVRRVAA